jgi:hypothetical protein
MFSSSRYRWELALGIDSAATYLAIWTLLILLLNY